jgi:hypothetical protein
VDVIIIDARNSREHTKKVMDDVAVTAVVVLDDKRLSYDVFEIIGTPTTLIVDSQGRAVFKHVGYAEHMQEMMSAEIEALLSRARSL